MKIDSREIWHNLHPRKEIIAKIPLAKIHLLKAFEILETDEFHILKILVKEPQSKEN